MLWKQLPTPKEKVDLSLQQRHVKSDTTESHQYTLAYWKATVGLSSIQVATLSCGALLQKNVGVMPHFG